MIGTEQVQVQSVSELVAGLHLWLASMRSADGFGGPVSHWWRNSLQYTGVGLDWRYEGIITGYLTLYERTGSAHWLRLAQQAGDDLVAGQTSSSNFVASSFELNPYPGGNPGEAACDLALLRLASKLRESVGYAWERYLRTAELNMRDHHITRLWDRDARVFSDSLDHATFVPNKAATLTEAILLYCQITENSEWAERFALPTLEAIVRHQVPDGHLRGAIYQYGHGGEPVPWFFPFYVARCIPALKAGFIYSGDERFRDAALAAADFVMRFRDEDGGFPQVVYSMRRVNRWPRWVSGAGDILRGLKDANDLGGSHDLEPTENWVIRGRLPNGAIRTAEGFAAQSSQHMKKGPPEFRDIIPVCGWADKTFSWFAGKIAPGTAVPLSVATQDVEVECMLRDKRCLYRETEEAMEVWYGKRLQYRWRKGATWAEIHSPKLYWK